MKKIGISIINFNGQKDTIECLMSLSKVRVPEGCSIYVVVLDNASNTPFELESSVKKLKVEVIHSTKNKGFSGGHNMVIEKFIKEGFDYVLILNNDTELESNFLSPLIVGIESDKKIAVVGPKIYFYKGSEFHKSRYTEEERGKVIWFAGGQMDWKNVIGSHRGVDEVDKGQFNQRQETQFVSGCCLMVKVSVLKEIGLFDENYFLYYEDTDLQERIKQKNYKIVFVPESIIWHKNASAAGGSGSQLQDYYITRNRLLFGMKYAPFRARLALAKEAFRKLFTGRKMQKIGIRDFFLGNLGKGSYIPS